MRKYFLGFWLELENGRKVELVDTPELAEELEQWAEKHDCRHEHKTLVRYRTRGGGEQIREQCDRCGEMVTQPRKRADVADIESLPFDKSDLSAEFRAALESERLDILKRHYELQEEAGGVAYRRYLKSAEWAEKRRRVLQRAGGLCEGCRENPAKDIHHLTYQHVYNEFLFELVALCRECQGA